VRHAARRDAVVVWRTFAEPQAELGHEENHAERDRFLLWGVVGIRRVFATDGVDVGTESAPG